MKGLMGWALLGAFCVGSAGWAQTAVVSNVVATQRERSDLVDIRYDLSNAETNGEYIQVGLVAGSNTFVATSVSGDVGAGIPNGTDRHIVWNAAVDFPDGVTTQMIATIRVGLPE